MTKRFIRFISIELRRSDELRPVTPPAPEITSDTVERALDDAQQLIASQGPVSGIDRAHTALHGYLRLVCSKAGLTIPKDASLTALFKIIREQDPSLTKSQAHSEHVSRAANALAVIVDALNPLRNRASLGHANEDLLQEPEAMLAINCAQSPALC